MSSTATDRSPPGSASSASGGWRATSRRIASLAWPFARASSHRPIRTRPRMTVELSKYVSGWRPASWITPGARVTNTLYAQAAVVPTAMSVSIVAPPWRAARHAAE